MSDTLRCHGEIVLATVGLAVTAGVCAAVESALVSAWRSELAGAAGPLWAGSAVCALVAGVFACWIVGAVFAGLVDLLLVVDAGVVVQGACVVGVAQAVLGVGVVNAGLTWSWMWARRWRGPCWPRSPRSSLGSGTSLATAGPVSAGPDPS
ncbi:hypothetical protein [Lentzea terrae]|uniref:hypothetical protein n=1 Tax=Lentzea terrae TaxID=2200761 RepID=UPI000DD4E24E|nr:hypothetical protein [Lentzea terrae]